MLVLLTCAKTMSAVSKVKVPLTTIPRFQKEAAEIALQMSQFSVDELERLLRVNAGTFAADFFLLLSVASFGRDSCLSAGGGCRIAGIGESDFVFLLAVASDGYVHRGHPIGRRNLV